MDEKELIIENLKKYYPSRLDDFLNGNLEITVLDLNNEISYQHMRDLREKASIEDKENKMIIGFEIGVLFIKKEKRDEIFRSKV